MHDSTRHPRLSTLTRGLWLAGLVGLIGLHFWFPAINTPQPTDTFGVGEEGKKAFYRLVDRESGSARRNFAPLERFVGSSRSGLLCVLGANREPTPGEWDRLLEWVANGGALVYAFPYEVFDRPLSVGEERRASIVIPRVGITLYPASVGAARSERTPEVAVIETSLVDETGKLAWRAGAELEVTDPNADVLLTVDGSVQAARLRIGAGRLVVVATDEPFTNYALALGDRGVFGFRLLETAGLQNPIVFDESLNDSATPKVVGVLLDPDVRPLTIQLVIVVFLFCWWGRERFGPILPDRTPPQQDVIAHSDALGTLVHRAGDGQGALRAYYRQLLGGLGLGRGGRRRGRSGANRSDRVLAPIARRLGVEVSEVKETLRAAREACRNDRLGRREAARQIRRLAEIRRAAVTTSHRRSPSTQE